MPQNTNINPDPKNRGERVPLALQIMGEYTGAEGHVHPFQGETQNASFEGLCMKLDNSTGLKAGQDIQFKTQLYPNDFFIKGNGTVCWIKHPSDDFDKPEVMGVKITNMRRYSLWMERIEEKIIHLA
jgi:hypothetical protein